MHESESFLRRILEQLVVIIPDSMFCMLVIMALITTYMTTPLLRRLMASGETRQQVLTGTVKYE